MNYIRLYRIQNELIKHYNAFQRCTDIPQVIRTLSANPENLQSKYGNPLPPNSASLDDDTFIACFAQSLFPVQELLNSPDWRSPDSFFTAARYVHVFQHMNYTHQSMHRHPHFEIVYLMRGTCSMTFEKKHLQMQTGDVCIIAPGSVHEITLLDPSAFVLNILLAEEGFSSAFTPIMMHRDLISTYFETILHGKGMPNYLYIHTSNSDEIKSYLKMAAFETMENTYYASSRAINWLGLFFGTILNEFRSSVRLYHFEDSTICENHLLLIQYIQANYRTATLESVASFFHYNKTYLSRLITRLTGKKFTEIISDLRLTTACDYLRETDLQICDISDRCGYQNQNYFAKAFKKQYGITPTEYRQSERS